MYHYLIMFNRDDGAVRPLVSKEKLEAIFDGTLFMLSFITDLYLIYNLIKGFIKIGYYLLLSSGTEISIIMLGLAALYLGKRVLDELTEKLTKKFEELKKRNEELKERNVELTKRNVELTKKLTKRNIVTDDAELILDAYYN